MQQVNVFIETSSRFRGNVERKCGYVLSTQLRTGKETREHFGRVTGTYHQAILLTMVDALNHMTRTCDVCFYISDLYVTSRLGKITEMAGSGWLDTKGKPIANREEWRRLFKAINQLPDPHKISAKTEKHSYSAWLREEMKHRECGRILGQGLEPAPGARQINNGMSGYHYYCIREYYYSGRDKGKQKTDSEYADDLKADVYNMEVKNHHNFSVCGGFIVHNCCDAVRYLCSTIIGRKAARFREIRR